MPKKATSGSFKKGDPRCGRPAGKPNKATREVQVWAREIVEDPTGVEKTRELYQKGKLAPAIVIELMNRAYGKVKDTIEMHQPRPLVVEILADAEAHGDGGSR